MSSHKLLIKLSPPNQFNKSTATQYLNHVKSHRYAKITKVSKSVKSKPGPQALNTVQLLKIASSAYHIGPHQAMVIAERLYTQGLYSLGKLEASRFLLISSFVL